MHKLITTLHIFLILYLKETINQLSEKLVFSGKLVLSISKITLEY